MMRKTKQERRKVRGLRMKVHLPDSMREALLGQVEAGGFLLGLR